MHLPLPRLMISAAFVMAVTVTPAFCNDQESGVPKPELITRAAPALYRLGSGDEISVQQANAEELDGATARVDDLGFVNMPLTGRVQLSGLTLEEAEAALKERLGKLLLNPEPVLSITQYRSQPVSVVGAVNTPGVIQLQGRKTLVEMISMAGGVRADAGTDAEITRRMTYGKIPLQNAVVDGSGQFSTSKVNLPLLLRGTSPATNIVILPQDIISVPRAELIYVTGDVKKPGGFPLTTNGSISVLQAVALAEGVTTDSVPQNAKIFRSKDNGEDGVAGREELTVDVRAIQKGKIKDFDLKPRDILFIPDSTSKRAGTRAAEAALQAVVGIAIWHAW
jgi:polysaccharide export outer membrane protein